MKAILRTSTALLAILFSASAMAADLSTLPPAPMPAPPVQQLRHVTYDWTGGYAGAYAAGSCVDGILIDRSANLTWANQGCGFKGGGLVGYNRQFGNLVIGAELDAGLGTVLGNNQTLGANFTTGADFMTTARLRGGWAWDDTLFYLTGGGAFGQTYVNSATTGKMTAMPFGYVFGGGIEHAFTDHFRMRAEYIYTHMLDSHYTCPVCNVDVQWGTQHEARIAAIWAF